MINFSFFLLSSFGFTQRVFRFFVFVFRLENYCLSAPCCQLQNSFWVGGINVFVNLTTSFAVMNRSLNVCTWNVLTFPSQKNFIFILVYNFLFQLFICVRSLLTFISFSFIYLKFFTPIYKEIKEKSYLKKGKALSLSLWYKSMNCQWIVNHKTVGEFPFTKRICLLFLDEILFGIHSWNYASFEIFKLGRLKKIVIKHILLKLVYFHYFFIRFVNSALVDLVLTEKQS